MKKPKKELPSGVSEHRGRDGVLRYRARLTVDGKRQSLGLFATAREAGRCVASAKATLGGDLGARTLESWGKDWLDRRETDGVHRAAKKDRSTWKHVAAAHFYHYSLRKIARTDVVRWIRQLVRTDASKASTTRPSDPRKRETTISSRGRRLATQTIRNALGLLRRALGDAADEGHVASNVALGVKVPRVATSDEAWAYLDAAEIDAVLASKLTAEQRAIFTVAIFTGLRAGELWGLRWVDVVLDGKRPELVVRFSYRGPTKGGRVRRVPLLRQAREALAAWRKARPGVGVALVFPADTKPSEPAGGCHSEGFDAAWRTVREDVGITRRMRFHDLRHTCASHLVIGTWGRAWRLEEVQAVLGHRSITTTERYAHLAPEALHGARAATDAASLVTQLDTRDRSGSGGGKKSE